ncbi:MAG: hypothetical protein H7Y02_04135 [Candidatus Obscuribacterales bacterium]|nr:hypothetical protein [Steroidobacteraceae bacterium]
MAADVLLANAKVDTVGADFSIRIIGSQIPPAKMSIQIAVTGKAQVEIQGRLHKSAPWAKIVSARESCLLYIDPINALRAVTTETSTDSSVSVWAAWGV